MGMISSLFMPGRSYQHAADTLQDNYQRTQGIMQPYMQQGQAAYAPLQGAMQSLLNPQQLQNDWAQGYEMSPYAQMMQSQATEQGMNAASSMGLMGSTPAIQAIQGGASQVMSQDRDNYLNSLMQKYLAGAGMAQGLYGQGAQMGSQLGQMTDQYGQNQASLTYGKGAASGKMMMDLLGILAGAATGGVKGA
jgi:hypothetical protein